MAWDSPGRQEHIPTTGLKAIFAYLKTVKPITNHVPDPLLAGPPPKQTGGR